MMRNITQLEHAPMKMMTSLTIATLLLATFLAQHCPAAEQTQDRPNFLFILSDDQAPDAMGALGNEDIKTPHLDTLARRGTTFTHCFNQGSWSGAVCVASRTMLITGQTVYRAPRNTPYLDDWAHAKGPLAVHQETAVKLWPEVFRDAGYQTFLTGKWHNSLASVGQGFTSAKSVGEGFYDTHEGSRVKYFDNPGYQRPAADRDRWTPWDPSFHGHWTPAVRDLQSNGELGDAYDVQQHTSELYADAAVDFLTQSKRQASPFFMFVAFNAPHDPRQSPRSFVEQYPPEQISLPANYLPEHPFNNGAITIRDEQLAPFPRTEEAVRVHRSEYYAMITHMDREIGRILKALDESGEAGNTYVVFTSDHGLAMGSHGLMGKQNPYDHSIRMPFVICGPGIPKNRRVNDMIYMQSVYPTTCELAGLSVPESVEFSSVKTLATGESKSGGEPIIYGTYLAFQRLVRTQTHKLIYYPKLDRYQLFDLVNDPGEITDLSADPSHASVLKRLKKRLTQQRTDLGDGMLKSSPSTAQESR
ncbi:choline-sulfatase [Neorhodopirellula lusitana]|uniref:Choline-sulfatase n=1 Tax=Neorhodopirellula lusitana TaxID=445327 RepID=A0ABY1QE58_9BACT|nr:sulfatase-like hydrolase/transferase [Neorhodopirellula lusitana]SMP68951.1 choline-sulfatase [Neorhodopirellula lusitana]